MANSTMSRARYQKLIAECNRMVRSGELKVDNACANCGSTDRLEIHHIVPLQRGGKNVQGNVVRLCWRCHRAAHDRKHQKESSSGRKRIQKPDNWNEIADQIVTNQVGVLETAAKLGIGHNTMNRWLNEYTKENDINKCGKNYGKGGRP